MLSHLSGSRIYSTNSLGHGANGHPFANPILGIQNSSCQNRVVFNNNGKPIHQESAKKARDSEQTKRDLKETQQKFLAAKDNLKIAQQEVIRAEDYLKKAQQDALSAGHAFNKAANNFSRAKLAADQEDQKVRDGILNTLLVHASSYSPVTRIRLAKTEVNKLIDIILDSKNSTALMPVLDFSKINFGLLCSLATIPELKMPSLQPGKMITVPANGKPTPQDLVLHIARALNMKVLSNYLDKAIFP